MIQVKEFLKRIYGLNRLWVLVFLNILLMNSFQEPASYSEDVRESAKFFSCTHLIYFDAGFYIFAFGRSPEMLSAMFLRMESSFNFLNESETNTNVVAKDFPIPDANEKIDLASKESGKWNEYEKHKEGMYVGAGTSIKAKKIGLILGVNGFLKNNDQENEGAIGFILPGTKDGDTRLDSRASFLPLSFSALPGLNGKDAGCKTRFSHLLFLNPETPRALRKFKIDLPSFKDALKTNLSSEPDLKNLFFDKSIFREIAPMIREKKFIKVQLSQNSLDNTHSRIEETARVFGNADSLAKPETRDSLLLHLPGHVYLGKPAVSKLVSISNPTLQGSVQFNKKTFKELKLLKIE